MDLISQLLDQREAAKLDERAKRIAEACRHHSACDCATRAIDLRRQAATLRRVP